MFDWHPSRGHPSLTDREPRERIRFTDPAVPARACCCPARPAVKVVMPPAPGRDKPVDLWLCRHHYRVSFDALHAGGAVAEDIAFADDQVSADHAAAHAHAR